MLSLRGPGGDSLVLMPEHGGAILGWQWGATALLRHTRPEAAAGGNPHAMGAFPLVPYGNRIAHGRFIWAGRTHQLALNFGDHPHSIHGIGWQRAWAVESVSDSTATLSLRHRPAGTGDWPFAFDATLAYALETDGLRVDLAATNRDAGAAPMGLGLHPYFPRVDGASIRFGWTGMWENGPDSLPCALRPAPPDAAAERAVGELRLDNCFCGVGYPAAIGTDRHALRLGASAVFANLQVFTPHWAEFYCAEPVSHVPDALNRPELPAGQAMAVLAPGETLAGTISLRRVMPAS
jgi:aldose 1-epimerase